MHHCWATKFQLLQRCVACQTWTCMLLLWIFFVFLPSASLVWCTQGVEFQPQGFLFKHRFESHLEQRSSQTDQSALSTHWVINQPFCSNLLHSWVIARAEPQRDVRQLVEIIGFNNLELRLPSRYCQNSLEPAQYQKMPENQVQNYNRSEICTQKLRVRWA